MLAVQSDSNSSPHSSQLNTQSHSPSQSSSTHLYSELATQDFKFKLNPKGTNTECRNYYCIGADDSLVLIFISYTTIGWSTSIQISVLYYNREHDVNILESESHSASKATLTRDGQHLQVGDFVLDASDCEGGITTIRYKSSKPGGINLKLRIRATAPPFQLLDGTFYYGPRLDQGTLYNSFFPACHAHGLVEVGAVECEFVGKATALHILQSCIMPHHAINRTWFTYFVSDDESTDLCLLDTEAPKRYEHRHAKSGHLIWNGEMIGVTAAVTTLDTKHAKCEHSGYSIPIDFQFKMQGKTFDGRPFHATIETDDRELFGTVDILNKLPGFIRLLVKTFVAKPYLFQWLCKATMVLKVGDEEERVVTGRLYHEHSITNQ